MIEGQTPFVRFVVDLLCICCTPICRTCRKLWICFELFMDNLLLDLQLKLHAFALLWVCCTACCTSSTTNRTSRVWAKHLLGWMRLFFERLHKKYSTLISLTEFVRDWHFADDRRHRRYTERFSSNVCWQVIHCSILCPRTDLNFVKQVVHTFGIPLKVSHSFIWCKSCELRCQFYSMSRLCYPVVWWLLYVEIVYKSLYTYSMCIQYMRRL
jgi:hypothetical protein